MAVSISFQQQGPSVLEPIIDQMVEKALLQSELKIQDLLDRLFELIREPQVRANEKVEAFLKKTIKQIDYRSPLEFLGREEQRFYNYSSSLIDRKEDKIDTFCFETLQNVTFTDPPECDEGFNIYRIAIIRKQMFEKQLQGMRDEIDTLKQRLDRYMTMITVPMTKIPQENGTHKIPELIPKSATHLLLYVKVYSGSAPSQLQCNVILSNSTGYQQRFYYHTYGQGAVSYNSENIWMEICPQRELTVSGLNGPLSSHNVLFEIYATGYK